MPPLPKLFVTADSISLFTPSFFKEVVGRSIGTVIEASGSQRTACLYFGASNGDNPDYYDVFQAAVEQLSVSRHALTCHHVRADDPNAEALMHEAVLIVLSGGSVHLGWDAFKRHGIDSALRRAAQADVVILGVSAGAIQMGKLGYTGSTERDAELYDTLGLSRFIFAAHDEDEDWRAIRAALAKVPVGQGITGLGLPKGSAAALHADGAVEPFLKPLTLLSSAYPSTAPGARGDYPLLRAGERHTAAKINDLLKRARAPPQFQGNVVEVIRKLPIPDPLREQLPGTVRLVLISDTHSKHRELSIPPGDVLIHCGDFCDGGSYEELDDFCNWLDGLPHKMKVVTAGNHDWCLDEITAGEVRCNRPGLAPHGITTRALVRLRRSAHYLEDSGVTFGGLRFWGSPWQPKFEGAFNKPRGLPLRKHWDLVPHDTDVLITHTPPAGHLDSAWRAGSVGCGELMACIQRVRPQICVFGHIHECHGLEEQEWLDEVGGETTYINAASVDVSCCPRHPPIVVDLATKTVAENSAVDDAIGSISLVDVGDVAPAPQVPTLNGDVMDKIAILFEWDPSALCVLSGVSQSWRAAFAPLLKSFSRRLDMRIEEISCDELLRRPILWRERRRALVHGIEPEELVVIHHQLSTMTSLQEFLQAGGADGEEERWRVSTEVTHTVSLLTRGAGDGDWRRSSSREPRFTKADLTRVDGNIDRITCEALDLARRSVNQDCFNQRRATTIAGPTVGALAAWCAAVVSEADFFLREPEAREANEELVQLRRLRQAWNSPLARAVGELPRLAPRNKPQA